MRSQVRIATRQHTQRDAYSSTSALTRAHAHAQAHHVVGVALEDGLQLLEGSGLDMQRLDKGWHTHTHTHTHRQACRHAVGHACAQACYESMRLKLRCRCIAGSIHDVQGAHMLRSFIGSEVS